MTTTTAAAVRPSSVRSTSSARLNADHTLVLAGLLVVLLAVAAASFTLSFTGVSAAAAWAAIPTELAWLVPVALEVAMLGYVVAASVRTHRGQRALLPWTLVWALTTVSSALNAAHAWDAGPGAWQGAVGAGLAGMFPFMTLAAAHVVVGVTFAPRPETTTDTDTRTAASAETTDTDTDTGRDTATSTTRTDVPADARRGDAVAVLVEPVRELHAATSTRTDTATDTGAGTVRTGRTPRTGGRVAEHRDTIVRLARTTDLSGRRIAEDLGLDKTAVCRVVREIRASARTTDADTVLLAI